MESKILNTYLYSWKVDVKEYPYVETDVDHMIEILDAVAREADQKRARTYEILREHFFMIIDSCVRGGNDPTIYKRTFIGAAKDVLKDA